MYSLCHEKTGMMLRYTYALIFTFLIVTSCSSQKKVLNGFEIEEPTVPADEILVGNPARDGIPAIDDPQYIESTKAGYLSADDKVIGVHFNGVARAYPLKILTWHELVNADVGGQSVVISYCPLCHSAYVFSREIKGQKLTFGVSGLLYNNNVIMFDRQTESLWSQMETEAINGPMKGTELEQLPASSTTWSDWRSRHPETKVLSKDTGYNRNYERSPYGNYSENREIMFPVTDSSDRFHPKALIAGVEIDGSFKAYPLSELKKSEKSVLHDTFKGKKLTIRYDKAAGAVRVTDEQGNVIPSNTLYWFAWYAFHPETAVYE